MKKKITKYEYIKQEIEGFEADLPDNPVYLFEFGYRVAYAIIPQWTTWNKEFYDKPEEIYQYDIIVVDPSLKEIKSFDISVQRLNEAYGKSEQNGGTLRDRAVRYIVDGWQERQVRTKEKFLEDFNRVVNEIKETLNINNLTETVN